MEIYLLLIILIFLLLIIVLVLAKLKEKNRRTTPKGKPTIYSEGSDVINKQQNISNKIKSGSTFRNKDNEKHYDEFATQFKIEECICEEEQNSGSSGLSIE